MMHDSSHEFSHELEETLTEEQPHGSDHHNDCSDEHFSMQCHVADFLGFMTTCMIEYAIICAAVMFVLWKNIGIRKHQPHRQKVRKQNFTVDCSSSTKGLFIGLLFMICTIVSMIVFFVKIKLHKDKQALWILYGTNSIMYVLSIGSCFAGLYMMRNLSYVAVVKETVLLLDDILLFIGLIGQLMFCIFGMVALALSSDLSSMLLIVTLLRLVQVLLQTVFILAGQRMVALTTRLQTEKPGREIVTFLLMVNLAMWLINTFETQKMSANRVVTQFYGVPVWSIIVHSSVPLTIFYRFHSSVCLAEIWKSTYRVKNA